MLLSETHLTSKYNFQIKDPDVRAHGGTGIHIGNRMKHHFHKAFENYLQATFIKVQLVGNTHLPFTGRSILGILPSTRATVLSTKRLQCNAFSLGIALREPKRETVL